MSDQQSQSRGRFVWYELMTTDPVAAKAFYRAVVGWGVQEMPMPGMVYTMLTAGETPVAGLMALPEPARQPGTPPMWTGYVAVDDVDESAERAKQLGGSVHVPPTDIPSVGRFAVILDPGQAAIALFKGTGTPPAPAEPGTPGHIGWHDLRAADGAQALAFYSALFGWKKTDEMDVGPMGTYYMFGPGDTGIGGMMTKPAQVPAPHWQYFFNVGPISEAAARVTKAGGTIALGPMEVPGGGWIVEARDPHGAPFGLFGAKG